MYDIFLSYSTNDRDRLMPLVRVLEQHGWTVFWDHLSIQIGEDWRDTIEHAVCNCRCVVVVWSKDSIKSKWVREEATEGDSRKVLLPIRIDNVNPPFGFRSLQAGNFIGWNGGADHFEFVRLSSQIRALVGENVVVDTSVVDGSQNEHLQQDRVFPSIFPAAWASNWGEDECGLWMGFTYKGVRQDFRWIKPGKFLMGSPLSELGRSNDEIQHEVTLSQGFWLADTACTQALWLAVMGNNPARFQDNLNNPVDWVSWEMTQDFIERLNSLRVDLNFRLPTEAEWEFACRAGTTTPFSFGSNITTEQVNYDGEYPYMTGEKGLSRKKTIAAKSFPANSLGLYEMHGNVYEWCADWYGDYSELSLTDPQGRMLGDARVLRGGSWMKQGRYCRSAARHKGNPTMKGLLYSYNGFRLARSS